MNEADWDRLVDQVGNGDCTPFLGAGACYGILPTGRQLSEAWATEKNYPLTDRYDLARVMQYAVSVVQDAVHVKSQLARRLGDLAPPDFADPAEPHGLLARLPLPVYLTTNYDNFMMAALRAVGKEPHRAICRWYRSASGADHIFETTAGYSPQQRQPLVFHLHGSFVEPGSMVLTEDDYLEFLINLVLDKETNQRKVLPPSILSALTTKPLLFIGYSLQDWNFRVIFHGLLRTISDVQRRRHVSVQLSPLPGDADPAAHQRAKEYLTDYFDRQHISLYWGTAAEFTAELRHRLGWTG